MDVVNFLKDNTRIPVIGAPLFTVSYPELVLAQCKAGVVGSFPALNARPEEKLSEWISMMKQELADYQKENPDAVVAPFAVNQICHHSNIFLLYLQFVQFLKYLNSLTFFYLFQTLIYLALHKLLFLEI